MRADHITASCECCASLRRIYALRRQVGALVPGVWYPFSSLIALDRLIIDRFGSGDVDFAQELGTYVAQRSYAALSRFAGGPHEFFSRAPMLHRDWYDFLSTEYVPSGEQSGMMLHPGYRSWQVGKLGS